MENRIRFFLRFFPCWKLELIIKHRRSRRFLFLRGQVVRINRIYCRNMEPRPMVYVEMQDGEAALAAVLRHQASPLALAGERVHKVELARPKGRLPPLRALYRDGRDGVCVRILIS